MTNERPKAIDLSFLRTRSAQKRVALLTITFLAAGVGYWLFAPKWFTSSVVLVPATPPKGSGISALLGGDMGSLASGLGGSLGSPDVPRISAVLQSAAVSDAVIQKLDLQKRYGASSLEAARDVLWSHCEVKALPKPGLVHASCEDKEPRFAQALVAEIAVVGNQVFRRVSVSSATEEVRYLERRVAELRSQADASAERVRKFQEKHQLVELDSQARAVVSAMATLNAQRIGKKMELEYAQTYSSRDEAGSRQIQSQLEVVEDALRDLETDGASQRPSAGAATAGRTGAAFPPAASVPALRAEYEGLFRDRKVAEATLVFALDRLEAARASEARDVSTFQVLDPATVPTRKSRPRGIEILAMAGFLGLIASVSLEWRRARASGAVSQ